MTWVWTQGCWTLVKLQCPPPNILTFKDGKLLSRLLLGGCRCSTLPASGYRLVSRIWKSGWDVIYVPVSYTVETLLTRTLSSKILFNWNSQSDKKNPNCTILTIAATQLGIIGVGTCCNLIVISTFLLCVLAEMDQIVTSSLRRCRNKSQSQCCHLWHNICQIDCDQGSLHATITLNMFVISSQTHQNLAADSQFQSFIGEWV